MAKKKKVEIPERKVVWHIQDDGSVSPIIQNQKQDIAPVQTKQSGFFKGSDAKNNWSIETDNPFMNVVQRANATLWGTILDAGTNVVRGATSSVEGIGDFAQNRVADVQDLFGHSKAAEKTRRKSEQVWGINQKIDDFDSIMNTTSVLGDKSDAVFQGVGTSLFAMGTGALGGAIGGTNAAASILSLGTMGLGAAGNSENQARQEMMADLKKYGFNTKQINNASRMYGLLSGVGETLSEMMFGGISQTSKVLGIGSGVFDSADDAVINALTKKLKTGIFKNFVQAGLKASGEGVEEIASGFLDAAAKKLTYMKDEDFGKLLKDEKLLDSFISGTLSATLTQMPSVFKSVTTRQNGKLSLKSNNEIRDFVSNLNAQEQQVVEREIENRLAQEENPTNKRRMQIEKQVIEDLDRGYISANTIRETLGENYNPERDIRLNESFNEETRRSQAYENDTSKYDEKQRATIQRAIDSGLLNNSNKTHDFVDLIAKLSADKGIDFDFTNNERIKESGFAIDGKQVNGFIQDGKVTLNLESNQALNKTVGHEITHVLEGTDLYNSLQDNLKSFIGEREWNNRISELEKTYKGVKGANIENELTSDLVGEYVFNDESFVRNLSTRNPNLFQKIFDEIKYMVKIATAGSKEARDLEKVKRAFEKAYRETSKEQQGTQYSLEQNYRGSHQIKDGTSIVNLDLNNIRNQIEEIDGYITRETEKDFNKLKKILNNPEGNVKIYRAAPVGELNNGDWVTTDKSYAKNVANNNGGKVYEYEVKANELNYPSNIKELPSLHRLSSFQYTGENQQNVKYSLTDNQNNESEKIALADGRTYNNYYEYAKDITKNKDELAKELLFKHYSQNFDVPANSNETKFYHGTDATFDYDGLKVMDFDEQTMDRNYGDYFYITTDKGFSHTYGSQIAEFIIPNDKILSLEDYRQNYSDKTDDELFNDYWALEMPDNEYIVKDIKPIIDYSKQRANDYINQQENTQYSLTDNQGRELSEQQQEYFKDSKLRNENGELEVVYHTTPNQFTVFDNTKLGENTEYSNTAFGFFVTPNKNFSQRFGDINQEGTKGNTMEMYANITNPITHPFYAGYKYEGEQLDNIVRDYMRATGNEQVISDLEASADEEGLSLYQTYMDMMLGEDPFETADFDREELIKNGYDAVEFVEGLDKDVNYNVSDSNEPVSSYAVFDSNQLKNTDNTTPTSNQDIRYSLTDNQGRQLSEQQQEFFKDSKVRDENGQLIEVYHGSPNEFTVFDKGKMKTGATMYASSGDGFYFTDSEAKADKYSKGGTKYSTYLNITNPFVVENKISNEAADLLYKFSQQVIENHPEATQKDIGAYELFDRNDIGQRSGTAILSNVVTEYGDEFTEYLKENRYDGIKSSVTDYDNVGEQYNYVAFESNQIKNVDNTNPTSNPDIRYSLSEDAETFKTPYGVEVVKNPSTDDYIQMRQDILEEYPWLRGEKILRQTYDEEGNVYYWNAYDAQHADVEPYINKKYNTRTFQNDGWWKNPIYKDSPKDYSYVDTSNFKYSLSDTDSQGKELTQGQKDFFKDVSPEVKDENNQLMRFYHGSNSGFTIFDLTKGSQSNSNAGVGFWFTPSMEGARNFADSVWYGDKTPTTFEVYLNMKNPKVYETYDNTEIRSNLKEQLDNTYKERKALTDKYSWETPSLTNLVSYMNYMDDAKLVENLKNNFKFKEENAKQYVEDAKKYIELNNQYKNIEKQFDDARWTDAYEQFRTDIYKIAGKSADDANTGGTGMALDNKEQVLKDYVNSLKEQGYDGIVIKNTVYDSNTMGGTNNQYVVFDPNQIKNVTNENPTDNVDIRYQLGNNEVAPTSGWNVRSEDVRLQSAFQDTIAPLQEQVQQLTDTITRLEDRIAPLNEQEADELYQETQRGFENEVAPTRENLTQEENQRLDMLDLLERNNMLTDEQRYEREQLQSKENPINLEQEVTPGQALSDVRDAKEIGSPKVKAYQYEHPEVKPYFQEEARRMLNDLDNTTSGGRYVTERTDSMYGDWHGIKRFTSPEIAALLDGEYGAKYQKEDIRKGLNAIIEDHGAENIAVAKRIELVLDERLRNGYDAWGVLDENGEQYHVAPNSEYLNMLAEQEWQNYFDDIANQYPIDDNQAQYALEQERQQEEQYKIDKSLEDMTAEDINLEPFLEGLQGARERQAERQQQREEINQKKEVKIPKQSNGRRAVNRGLGLLVNEFAVLDDYSKQTKNKDIKFKTDTYNNYQAIAQSNIETAQTDINGKRIGRSGNSIFEEAKRYGLADTFDEYLKQWANVDRAKQGKGAANFSAKESYKIVKEMEAKNPRLKKLGADMWQYYRNARHNLRDAGIISQEVSDMLGRMYPHYTPYISENIENYFVKDGELKPKATIKRAKGGAAIGSLLSAEEAMQRYTKSEFNTIFGNDLFKEIVNTSNDIVQLGGDDRGMQFVNADNLYADKNGYYLTAYENGNPITAKISEDMYRTLTRESRNRISDIENTFSAVTKPLQAASNIRRNILTSWSPTFMAKNFIKDFQEGIFNSKYTKDFIKNYPSAFKELATNTELAQQFKSLYGSGLTMGQYDIDANNYNPSGKNRNFLKGIKNVNELIELAPRYAEFKASIDHGASIQEAMYNAREVTTNFSRGGTLAKALNRNGFTFLNSSIQGFDKFIRNFSGENGAKGIVNSLAKAAIFGIAPAVFNELAFGSGDDKDEEYEALPDYIKDNYYIIKTGDGNFIRIPKGRVFSVFGSAARRTIEAMEGEENAFEGYWNNVQQQIGINNPEENNIFAPLIQAMGGRKLDSGQTAGEAWYGGDIIPSRLQKERPEDQYDASIDKFSIWLGQRTGISPYKINYVLDQYAGGMGDIGLPMITDEANSDGSIIAPIKDQFTADTITDNKYVSEFYDTKNKLYTGSKATDEDILKSKYMNDISKQMGELYAERREIQADTTLTKKEKYEKAQAIKSEINRLAKEGLDNYEKVGITGDYADTNGQEYQKTEDGWRKLNENTSDELNLLGLTSREKNNYIKTKQNISSIKEKYKDSDDYNGKKNEIIGEIINTNLDDNSKLSLYQDTYRDKLANSIDDLGINADTYLEYKAQDFSADKDKNGKSISGSKKRKVFDYINSLDIPYQQKLILAKSEYNSFNDNNAEIIEYIENSGMDYSERIELYKNLGFKVDGDNISW